MDRRLLEYLPPAFRDAPMLRAVLDVAEQPELERLWSAAEDVERDQFLLTATENGIARWEEMLGIAPLASDTLEDRRFCVLVRLMEELPYTWGKLKEMLLKICGADGYTASLTAGVYKVTIRVALGQSGSEQAVMNMLRRVLPANMTLDYSLLYNRYGDLEGMTYEQLAAFTHEQIRSQDGLS